MLEQLPAARAEPSLNIGVHPLAREQNAVLAQEQRQLESLDKTYRPQFFLQGLASARGTGMLTNGDRLGGANGLAPTTQNYALGLTVTFPAMDKFAIREQEAMQSADVRAAQAQYQVIAAQLEAQFNAALAALDGARRVATNTPAEVASARATLRQAARGTSLGWRRSMMWRRHSDWWSRPKSTMLWRG